MELKHTKGQWTYCGGDNSTTCFEIAGKIVVEVKRHCHNTGIEEMSREEMEANAKLCASAPDLLAALIEAEEALRWFMSNTTPDNKNDYQSYHDTGMNAIEQAKTAIQKATS
jgi:hypothetical protein